MDMLLLSIIILTGIIEAIWGMMQLYDLRSSQHSLFKITGSFFNPGPFAGYLAVIFPLALHFLLESDNRHSPVKSDNKIRTFFSFLQPLIYKWLGGIACIAIILVLPASMSRASWLAAIAGSIVVLVRPKKGIAVLNKNYFSFKKKGVKIFVFIMVFCLTVVAFTGIYYLKKDSADGRMLTWKVSLTAIVQNPLGVGLGNFPSAYGEVQAAYFASGNASEAEEYLAGNPEYGFNEFLQIGIESGIVSLLLFIGMLVCAFRGLVVAKHWGVMGALVALLVFACFSYPFSVLPFLLIFVFLLAMSSAFSAQNRHNSEDKKSAFIRSIRVICVPSVCMIFTLICLWKQYPVYGAYKFWKSNQVYYQSGMYKEVVQNYEPLYHYLDDQIKFLFEYGRSLSMTEQPEKSNIVLHRAMQISCDPMLYNIMGKNYQALKKYDLAEENFRKASLIVPNRIYPYYLLMLMYVDAGDKKKAKAAARIVLTKEPKVMSTAVEEMRKEAKQIENSSSFSEEKKN